MQIETGSKLVMIGDSITDAGRSHPIGEGLNDALGRGYVAQVAALLGAVYPERAIRIVNVGSSGNTVRDLNSRWQRDVFDLKPDWLSVMIGINDVWRQFDMPRQTENHVLPEEYEATLDALIASTRPVVKNIVLMTPFYIEPNPSDAMRSRMDVYGGIVRRLAQKHGTQFVDVQAAFNRALEHYYPAALAWDRVHPNHTGHMVITRSFLNTVGFEWL